MKKLFAFLIISAIMSSCYRPQSQSWQPKKSFSVSHTKKKRS